MLRDGGTVLAGPAKQHWRGGCFEGASMRAQESKSVCMW